MPEDEQTTCLGDNVYNLTSVLYHAGEVGQNPRHYLSAGFAVMQVDSSGVPFDMPHIYASGNIAADMYANVAAEATGRALATRLYHMTDDAGMKDMISFAIARDTMHQQQWRAVLEEFGPEHLPVPNSFSQEEENQEYSYPFFATGIDGVEPPEARWTEGESLDNRNRKFGIFESETIGDQEMELGYAREDAYAQKEQQE